jgi:hypothetical protein
MVRDRRVVPHHAGAGTIGHERTAVLDPKPLLQQDIDPVDVLEPVARRDAASRWALSAGIRCELIGVTRAASIQPLMLGISDRANGVLRSCQRSSYVKALSPMRFLRFDVGFQAITRNVRQSASGSQFLPTPGSGSKMLPMRLDCLSGAAVSQLPVLCDHAIDQSLREKAE